MAVGGYDGMHLIYEGLKKTNGEGGQALVDAMKGMSWTSPRGPVSIDPQTRDIVQNIYVRKVGTQGRRALQRRIRHHPERQGPGESRQVQLIVLSEAPSIDGASPTTPGENGADHPL